MVLGELISELQERRGRQRQKKAVLPRPRRLPAAQALIGLQEAYALDKSLHSPGCLRAASMASNEKSERCNMLLRLCFRVGAACNAVWPYLNCRLARRTKHERD